MSIVSVIVPAYNAEKYLQRCLESILNQSYKNIEVLLINDGSTDDTFSICNEYASIDERIRVFHNENQGVSEARNCGIDNSKGKYIVFIDADDYVEPNYIEGLVRTIEKEKVDLVICGIKEIINGKEQVREPRGEITGDFAKDYFVIVDFLCVPFSKIYRNHIIKEQKLRFLKELNYAEDEVFNYFYYRHVKKYIFNSEAYYVYEHHQDSLSDKRKFREKQYLYSYIMKLRLEKNFFDESNIEKKEEVIGEHGMRAIMHMADLSQFKNFVKDARLVRRYIYKIYKYDKISKIIFATLLNLEIYFPLYIACKMKNYFYR